MKHFNKRSNRKNHFLLAQVMMWLAPFILIIPNVCLDFTESNYSFFARLTNVFIPFGIYLYVVSSGRMIGRRILCLIPIIVFCCFQTVLLFIYGESIIAIDMFLNFVTTDMHEASELLGNIGMAIGITACIYFPLIGFGIWAEVVKAHTNKNRRIFARRISACSCVLGVFFMIISYNLKHDYDALRQLFPLNVVYNIVAATERSAKTIEYNTSSENYKFQVSNEDVCPTDSDLIVAIVVGETSRADHWQLEGYTRETNPLLSKRDNLVFFKKTLSESNITHKSVPLMLTHLTAKEFGDSIYLVRSIIDTFNEAGYITGWLSSQSHNHSIIDFFSKRADYVEYICDEQEGEYTPVHDIELVSRLSKFLSNVSNGSQTFVVIHTYGSHFCYKERYLPEEARFFPDNVSSGRKENVADLVNAYDNSIIATDCTLDSIMSVLESTERPALLIYASDHGEDIFDDYRERFLHASPHPTYYQLHVPMLIWWSDKYGSTHPNIIENLKKNKNRNISSSESVFHTAIGMAGLKTPAFNPSYFIGGEEYHEHHRRFLNDYNESVDLETSGLKKIDFEKLKEKNIYSR